MQQGLADTVYALAGSIDWHLHRGSYQPVTGPGFLACRAQLPWWRVFGADGAPAAAAEFGSFQGAQSQ
jgi:hypothetical protein